jgi:uncharacterized protein DUF4159
VKSLRRSSVARRLFAAVLLATVLVGASTALAQRRRGGGGRFFAPMRMATPESFDGSFNFCRIIFAGSNDGDGNNWSVDYPRADINLSVRLAELTKTRISLDVNGEPNHVVLRLTDDALFQCPFIMMTEVGSTYLSDEEASRLRDYLLKGGFLWADDFWGSYAWEVWVREISKVLPGSEFPIVDLPLTHPLFRAQFEVKKGVIQIPSINSWWGMGGGTSERGADSAEPHARGISDAHGRLMVLITHNTDYGDAFEREGDDPSYFYRFSVDGYAFGINTLLYALTH